MDSAGSSKTEEASKRHNIPWWGLALIALALGIVSGQIIVNASLRSEKAVNLPAEGSGGSSYPDALRKSFLDGCVKNAAQSVGRTDATQICGCVLDKLESAYSVEDFIQIFGKMQEDSLPPALEVLVAECVRAVNDG